MFINTILNLYISIFEKKCTHFTKSFLLIKSVFGKFLPLRFHGEANNILPTDSDQLLCLRESKENV